MKISLVFGIIFSSLMNILVLGSMASSFERLRLLEDELLVLADRVRREHGNFKKSDKKAVWHKKLNCEDIGATENQRPVRLVMASEADEISSISSLPRTDRECSVLYFPGKLDITNKTLWISQTEKFEAVFGDDSRFFPFHESISNRYYFDNNEYNEDSLLSLLDKRLLVSMLFPNLREVRKDKRLFNIFLNASSLMSDHIYFDDGTDETYLKAFKPYFFTVIFAPLATMSYPPVVFLKAMERHTIPMIPSRDGDFWLPLGFRAEAATWRVVNFDLKEALPFLTDLIRAESKLEMDQLLVYRYLNMRNQQDLSIYKYALPAESRLLATACAVCKTKESQMHLTYKDTPPMIFIAIFSTRSNIALRQTIRQTWLSVLTGSGIGGNRFNFVHRFFVGLPAKEWDERIEDIIHLEQDVHGDLVELDVPENYRNITLKSMLMYNWVSEFASEASFFIRIDDDMYLRPQPLIDQILRRTPARYWWGSFAHFSSVVRNESDFKNYNSIEQFSDGEIFPLLSRGVLYVLSMDLLQLIVRKNKEGFFNTRVHPDDTALGVYMYQLVTNRVTHVLADDRDENRLALNPFCKHHFSQLQNVTWAVHHVSTFQIRCMWEKDISEGYYKVYNMPIPTSLLKVYEEGRRLERESDSDDLSLVKDMLLREQVAVLIDRKKTDPETVAAERVVILGRRRNFFPELCDCATPGPSVLEYSDFDSSYDRFLP